jgi:uncharacterized lipoprotein NlpE involved in copper resistance
MTEIKIVQNYQTALDMAERNGFQLDVTFDYIKLVANRPPYATEVTLRIFDTFKEAICYMGGYEQHELEMRESR